MNGRYFIDTNVFVYSFDHSAVRKARRARELIRQAVAMGSGVVSFQVVQEFFNVALRKFAKPMASADAQQYLATVFRPLMAVSASEALYAEGLRIAERYRLSWYDSLILAAAIEADCSVIYSEDLQDGFAAGGVRVMNPFR